MSKRKKNVKRAPKGTLRRVFSYLRGYRFYLIASLILSALTVALTLWLPVLLGNAIDHIIAPGRVDFDVIKGIFFKAAIAICATALLTWLISEFMRKKGWIKPEDQKLEL